MAKVVCVLYDDPVDGYPKTYARDDMPKLDRYPGRPDPADARRRSTSSPASCSARVSGELGLAQIPRGPAATSWS